MEQFTNEDARYARKVLGERLPASGKERLKSMVDGTPTHWVSLPVTVIRQMLSGIRGNDEEKPLPYSFMGGKVIASARIPVKPGLAAHQGLIIRQYEEDGEELFSVHYLVAQHVTDTWSGDMGQYGIQSREKAFSVFMERMHQRGGLKR